MLLCDAGSITYACPSPVLRTVLHICCACTCMLIIARLSSSAGMLQLARRPSSRAQSSVVLVRTQNVDPKALCFQMARTYSLETWRCGCMPRRYTGFKKLLGLGRESSLLFDANLAKLLLHLLTNAGSSHGIECR
jgi:hypothetical protein